MSIEEALKVPLMSKEDGHENNSHWHYSTEFHPSLHKKTSRLKRGLFYIFVIFPWALLALLSVWSWKQFQETRTRYYVRPDLAYSKHSSP